MVDMLARWQRTYPVVSIEDGLSENDWSGWQTLTQRLGHGIQLVGDDLFTTDIKRVEQGISTRAATPCWSKSTRSAH